MNEDELKKIFNSKGNILYHYTTLDSAIKIVTSNRLKFGKAANMNDINEQSRMKFYSLDFADKMNDEDIDKELAKYLQISLCIDDKNKGFNIPSMWGHYAEGGNGACLAFDMKSLLNSTDKSITSKKVRYEKEYDGSIDNINNIDINKFLWKKKKIFFVKSKDWSYEQEFRLIKKVDDITNEYFLDYPDDSLIAIILYNNCPDTVKNSLRYDILNKLTQHQIFQYTNSVGNRELQLISAMDNITIYPYNKNVQLDLSADGQQA